MADKNPNDFTLVPLNKTSNIVPLHTLSSETNSSDEDSEGKGLLEQIVHIDIPKANTGEDIFKASRNERFENPHGIKKAFNSLLDEKSESEHATFIQNANIFIEGKKVWSPDPNEGFLQYEKQSDEDAKLAPPKLTEYCEELWQGVLKRLTEKNKHVEQKLINCNDIQMHIQKLLGEYYGMDKQRALFVLTPPEAVPGSLKITKTQSITMQFNTQVLFGRIHETGAPFEFDKNGQITYDPSESRFFDEEPKENRLADVGIKVTFDLPNVSLEIAVRPKHRTFAFILNENIYDSTLQLHSVRHNSDVLGWNKDEKIHACAVNIGDSLQQALILSGKNAESAMNCFLYLFYNVFKLTGLRSEQGTPSLDACSYIYKEILNLYPQIRSHISGLFEKKLIKMIESAADYFYNEPSKFPDHIKYTAENDIPNFMFILRETTQNLETNSSQEKEWGEVSDLDVFKHCMTNILQKEPSPLGLILHHPCIKEAIKNDQNKKKFLSENEQSVSSVPSLLVLRQEEERKNNKWSLVLLHIEGAMQIREIISTPPTHANLYDQISSLFSIIRKVVVRESKEKVDYTEVNVANLKRNDKLKHYDSLQNFLNLCLNSFKRFFQYNTGFISGWNLRAASKPFVQLERVYPSCHDKPARFNFGAERQFLFYFISNLAPRLLGARKSLNIISDGTYKYKQRLYNDLPDFVDTLNNNPGKEEKKIGDQADEDEKESREWIPLHIDETGIIIDPRSELRRAEINIAALQISLGIKPISKTTPDLKYHIFHSAFGEGEEDALKAALDNNELRFTIAEEAPILYYLYFIITLFAVERVEKMFDENAKVDPYITTIGSIFFGIFSSIFAQYTISHPNRKMELWERIVHAIEYAPPIFLAGLGLAIPAWLRKNPDAQEISNLEFWLEIALYPLIATTAQVLWKIIIPPRPMKNHKILKNTGNIISDTSFIFGCSLALILQIEKNPPKPIYQLMNLGITMVPALIQNLTRYKKQVDVFVKIAIASVSFSLMLYNYLNSKNENTIWPDLIQTIIIPSLLALHTGYLYFSNTISKSLETAFPRDRGVEKVTFRILGPGEQPQYHLTIDIKSEQNPPKIEEHNFLPGFKNTAGGNKFDYSRLKNEDEKNPQSNKNRSCCDRCYIL